MAASALRVLETNAIHYRRTWKGSAVTTFLTPVLFLLAMGVGLGTLVDRGAGPAQLAGVSYLQFLAPGLLAATAMQTGTSEASWPVLVRIKWSKTYLAALATPIRPLDLVVGLLGWTAIRLAMTAVAFAVVLVAFGVSGPLRSGLAVGPAVLCGLAFAGPVAAFAATQDNGYGLTAVFRFGIVPMFLFSGTFFPITQLPQLLQPLAAVTPLWHGVELTRGVVLGSATAWVPAAHGAYLLAWFAAGAVAAERLLTRRLVQ